MDTWFPTFRRLAHSSIPFPALWSRYANLAQRRALLRLIAVAAEENLPLSPLLESWAADERRAQKHRLLRLADQLKAGTPLPDAIEAVPGLLRDEDILAIRFGAQSGTLSATLRAMLDQSEPALTDSPSPIRRAAVYVYTFLLIALLVITYLQVKTVPEFEKILCEFDVEPPQALLWSIGFARFFVSCWWLGALAGGVLLWSMFSARPGRFIRYSILGRLSRSARELRSAEVLQKLGIAAQAGRPIPGVLSTLARYHFDPIARHKLLFVRNEIEQGADAWHSLAAVDLLSPAEVNALATSERVGNRPWVLKQLAFSKRRRTMRRLDRMAELVLPLIVGLLGIFVLFQALSVFLLLTRFITGLL